MVIVLMNIPLIKNNISKLPIIINPVDQHELLCMFMKEIEKKNPLIESKTKIGATRMTLKDHPNKSVFPYLDRVDTSLDWQWLNHPIATKVQEILQPLEQYTNALTRVSIQIQPQDEVALPHWDDGGFRREKWPQTGYHGYVIRAPLTTIDEGAYIYDLINAPFFAIIGGRKINMSSDNHLFTYDARKTFHGGDYRPWLRGILGIFSATKITLPEIPMRITNDTPIINYTNWHTPEKIYEYFHKRSPKLFTVYSEYLKYTIGNELYELVMEIYNDRLFTN